MGGFCPREDLSRGILSKGVSPRGFCPGRFCPKTLLISQVLSDRTIKIFISFALQDSVSPESGNVLGA